TELSEAHGGATLSIRSSALGEDLHASFAGLHQSRLGVRPEDTPEACRQVMASLFSTQALAHRGHQGLSDADAEMAVILQVMVTPAASGVLYTRDPLGGEDDLMLVSAVPGLGLGLGDGTIDADVYAIRAGDPPVVSVRNLGQRDHYLELGPAGPRRRELDSPDAMRQALPADAVLQLVRLGERLQALLGGPLDVEWVRDREGRFWIVQARPLSVLECGGAAARVRVRAPVLLSGGQTARPGAASGPVFIVSGPENMAAFPAGAVLVARESSPSLASLLPAAVALITEVGGVAGHLAALAREYGVPALLGVRGALSRLSAGEIVTVDALGRRVYSGRVGALLDQNVSVRRARSAGQAEPIWLMVAQLVSRLNLTDPRAPDFNPRGCRSFHDLIRFMHEMSFREMFNLGDEVGKTAGAQARRLDARLPFELWFIDLGGGLEADGAERLEPRGVISGPGAAFLHGLLDPRVHGNGPRPVSVKGLASVFSGSLLTPPKTGQERDIGNRAYAVVGARYLNFNCRVGYHFTALDCYSGAQINDNYISFRFHGGAATEDRRSLRAQMVERILEGLEFAVERNGDAVSAFLKKRPAEEIGKVLAEMGRLILYTRQMDMLMDGPAMVEWLAKAFARGNYGLSRTDPESGA
ncbi:MAG: PEP/pyruvate-binding domain-containing protein, partial [Planctomycetota bacterium]